MESRRILILFLWKISNAIWFVKDEESKMAIVGGIPLVNLGKIIYIYICCFTQLFCLYDMHVYEHKYTKKNKKRNGLNIAGPAFYITKNLTSSPKLSRK